MIMNVMVAAITFEQQVVVVSGAGRGLGRAYAIELGRRGASVVVNDRELDRAVAVVGDVESVGGRAVASDADVSTPDGGAALVELAVSSYGTVDAVVNNAGFLRSALFEDLTV